MLLSSLILGQILQQKPVLERLIGGNDLDRINADERS
jgi:hypothetical protein